MLYTSVDVMMFFIQRNKLMLRKSEISKSHSSLKKEKEDRKEHNSPCVCIYYLVISHSTS